MSVTLEFKASLDTASQPVEQAVLTLSPHQLANSNRLALSEGPTIKLQIGENTTVNDQIPKRAAMALSVAFHNVLTSHPHAPAFMLNPDQASEFAVNTLVDFIVGNSKTIKPFKLRFDGLAFPDAISLYRHGVMFGMEQHIASLCAAITGQINDPEASVITFKSLDELVKLPVTDAVYQTAVRNLEGLTYIGALDGDEAWLPWLVEHLEFAVEMARWRAIREQRAAASREMRKIAKWERDFPPLA